MNGYLTITDSDKRGQEVEVNLYNERAQNYILDNLYEMI